MMRNVIVRNVSTDLRLRPHLSRSKQVGELNVATFQNVIISFWRSYNNRIDKYGPAKDIFWIAITGHFEKFQFFYESPM